MGIDLTQIVLMITQVQAGIQASKGCYLHGVCLMFQSCFLNRAYIDLATVQSYYLYAGSYH